MSLSSQSTPWRIGAGEPAQVNLLARMIEKITGSALIVSAIFMLSGCDSTEAPSLDTDKIESAAPECFLPECVDEARAGIVKDTTLHPEQIIKQQPAEYDYLEMITYDLPKFQRKDKYEAQRDYLKRVSGKPNSWRMASITPNTRFLVSTQKLYFDSYNADRGVVELTERVAPSDGEIISGVRKSTDDSYDMGRGSISNAVDSSVSKGLWFTNIRPIRDKGIDGICMLNYDKVRRNNGASISFKLPAAEAKASSGNYRIYYVVSFKAPADADIGEWCYTGMTRSDTTILVQGGLHTTRSDSYYINMHLHEMIVTDGKRAFWSKTF